MSEGEWRPRLNGKEEKRRWAVRTLPMSVARTMVEIMMRAVWKSPGGRPDRISKPLVRRTA